MTAGSLTVARSGRQRWPWGVLLWPLLLLICLIPGVLPRLLTPLHLGELTPFDPPLWRLTLTHLGLVALSTGIVLALGVPLAVAVTRPKREALRQLAETLVGLGQTVPTFAILALAVPALGFGWQPTLLGLIVYGLVPVVSNGIAGLMAVDASALDAARGMGMTGRQRLVRVELPLALPVLLAGVRTSTVYNVGTATVGAALGAGGLGEPIINGLSQQNTALVLVGAVLSALLALSLDAVLSLFAPRE
ncbi:ABC transporter permease [Deinococcus aquatilis]|jgi:osmoprotectant transport system permease protein|uniref:ABC transporter permease n=1 Tax=Deinococcus aquatilis TaxID=519440 RepID=UPI0003AAFFF2|nr:ABC transporter permease [Deinococcus aquatilis]